MRNEKDRMVRVNGQIKFSPVVVIDDEGKNLGSMPLQKARDIALESGLDLVEIAPNSRPPVCRVMDFGKFKFEQAMREKKLKKKQQKQSQTKEIRLTPSIQEHDLQTKLKSAIKFLSLSQKVNVKLEFKRREIAHQEIGISVINAFVEKLSEYGVPMARPKHEGRSIFCLVEPKAKVDAKSNP